MERPLMPGTQVLIRLCFGETRQAKVIEDPYWQYQLGNHAWDWVKVVKWLPREHRWSTSAVRIPAGNILGVLT